MRRILLSGLLAMYASLATIASANEQNNQHTLTVGIIPYLGARALISGYEPMRKSLEHQLGMPVTFFTAPSFKRFLLNAQNGTYDLVISPAHFARILQKENAFFPHLRYAKGGSGLIVTGNESTLTSIDDVRNKTIAVPFQLSLASIICLTALQEKGLKPGDSFKLLEVPSFESAILAVQNGDAVAAVSAPGALSQMNESVRKSVKPLLDTGEYISLVFLTHPRMSQKQAKLIHHALVNFSQSREGMQFLEKTGFGNMVPATPQEMASLDKYLPETRRLLSLTQQ